MADERVPVLLAVETLRREFGDSGPNTLAGWSPNSRDAAA